MDRETYERYEARAKVFKALGHPTRLFMVEELSKQERCVSELAEMVGVDGSTISRHLTVLKNAGIVSSTRRGAQIFYRLKVPCTVNFFSCVDDALKAYSEDLQRVSG
jgi:DNA-binding transcriptional ArsR family regulator